MLAPLGVELRFQDVCEVAVGASVPAIPSAFTEEVWRLGEQESDPSTAFRRMIRVGFPARFGATLLDSLKRLSQFG